MAELDIVIPVYNEGEGLAPVLDSLRLHVRTPFRVLICYDRDDDVTLPVVARYAADGFPVIAVKNTGSGVFGAITSGFQASTAPAVLMMPADDDHNAPRLDEMVRRMKGGAELVCPSRFMRGGNMVGCPWLKAALVRSSAFVLHHVARLPTHDPSNGFRLFSRRVLREIPLESTRGFTYSIEYLVKCDRLGWRIEEVPAEWYERKTGKSRFKVLTWLPDYLTWFLYPFGTRVLRRGPGSVSLRASGDETTSTSKQPGAAS
jgi:dolichol-phosphate mannosyltransferase